MKITTREDKVSQVDALMMRIAESTKKFLMSLGLKATFVQAPLHSEIVEFVEFANTNAALYISDLVENGIIKDEIIESQALEIEDLEDEVERLSKYVEKLQRTDNESFRPIVEFDENLNLATATFVDLLINDGILEINNSGTLDFAAPIDEYAAFKPYIASAIESWLEGSSS